MKLEGIVALRFLSRFADKENKIKGESLDTSFHHIGCKITYDYCEFIQLEMKYDEALMKNYVELTVRKSFYDDKFPMVIVDTLYNFEMTFRDSKSGRIFKLNSMDLRREESARINIFDDRMEIAITMSDLTIEFEPRHGEQESLLKQQF